MVNWATVPLTEAGAAPLKERPPVATMVRLGGTYANRSALVALDVPPGVVTVMLTVPVPPGETAVMWVALLTVNDAAAEEPNLTPLAAVNDVPVIVTEVPPPAGPEDGLMLV